MFLPSPPKKIIVSISKFVPARAVMTPVSSESKTVQNLSPEMLEKVLSFGLSISLNMIFKWVLYPCLSVVNIRWKNLKEIYILFTNATFSKKIDNLLEEYLSIEDIEEVIRCIEEIEQYKAHERLIEKVVINHDHNWNSLAKKQGLIFTWHKLNHFDNTPWSCGYFSIEKWFHFLGIHTLFIYLFIFTIRQ